MGVYFVVGVLCFVVGYALGFRNGSIMAASVMGRDLSKRMKPYPNLVKKLIKNYRVEQNKSSK